MARKLIVEIIGDASSLEREFHRSARGAKQFERTIGQIGRGTVGGMFQSMGRQVAFASGGFLGAAGLVSGLKASVTAASDLNEEVSKSRQVFGGSTASVRAWARQAPEALKTSQQAALAAASGFGAMLETAGLAQSEAADMSVTMTRLGADMASFNNEDPSEMLDRLRSGLAGEAEPLRRFGVLLSESRVQQEAVRMGLASSTKHLTEQQKVLARYSIILRDTAKQQGDVARTGDQFAGQQRELQARLEETAAVIGKQLLPKVTDTAEQFNKWLANPQNIDRVTNDAEKLARAFGNVASAVGKTGYYLDILTGKKMPASLERFLDRWDAFRYAGTFGLVGKPAALPGVGLPPPPAKAGPGSFDVGGVDPLAGLRDFVVGPNGTLVLPGGGGGRRGVSASQRNRWFDTMVGRRLDRVQDVHNLRGQVAALTQIAGLIRQRLRVTKDITRQRTLEDQLVGVYRERGDISAQIASAAAERLRQQREQSRAARMVYETPLGLQLAEARAGAHWGHGTRSVLVEIRKAARKALRSGNLLVQGQIDAWNTIASANQRLADMNKSRTHRMITAYHATSAAMAHGGQQPNAGAAGVLGQPLILQLDGRTIATAVVPHLQRSAKRSTATTTGRSSGTVHGI